MLAHRSSRLRGPARLSAPNVILAGLMALAAAAPCGAASPIDVYNDFVVDETIDGSYPPGVLQEIVDDASLFQYGDPLIVLRLRRAVQRELAEAHRPAARAPFTPQPPRHDPPPEDGPDVDAGAAAIPPSRPGEPPRSSPPRSGAPARSAAEDASEPGERSATGAEPVVAQSRGAGSGLGVWTIGVLLGAIALVSAALAALRMYVRRRRGGDA